MKKHMWLVILLLFVFICGCGSADSSQGIRQEASSMDDADIEMQSNSNSHQLEADDSQESEENQDFSYEDGANAVLESVQGSDSVLGKDNTEFVAIHTEHIYEQHVDRETGNPLVDMNYQVISLEQGSDALESTISRWMRKRQQDLEEEGLALMVETKEKQEEAKNEKLSSSLWHEIKIYRADSRMISFVDREYSYCVSAWNNDYTCVNIDAESGKILTLDNLVVDKAGFQNAAISYCLEELQNVYTNQDVDEMFVEALCKKIENEKSWCLDASGFVVVYEDDEMVYSNEGVIYVHIPYEIVGAYMNADYIWGDVYGVASLSCNQNGRIVIDGVENEICVEKQYDEYYIQQVQLVYQDTAVSMGNYLSVGDIYIINHPNWKYLVMDADMGSDDYQTYLYELQADSLGASLYLDGNLDASNIKTDGFRFRFHVNVLGTYITYQDCYFAESGELTVCESELKVEHYTYDYCDLVTIRELPVAKGEETIYLPVGSRLRIVSTDNASWAKILLLDNMEEVIVYFERENNYIICIDGVREYEYFETLPYAG